MKKRISMLLGFILAVSAVSGCGGKKKAEVNLNEADLAINFNDYKDSEDIPSWTGEKLKLKVWMDANAPEPYVTAGESKDDAVSPEIERVTGVIFDINTSFGNTGGSYDAKIAQLIASEEYPAMAYSLPELSDLVKSGALYDLTPYIEKYCPNIMKYYGPDTVFGSIWEEQKEKYGGMYALQIGQNQGMIKQMVEKDGAYDLTEEQILSMCGTGNSPHGYVYVREDILKMVYPEAHTSKELKEIYEKNGKYTEEEIFDVPWNTPQDFIDFLYKVDSLEIPDDGNGPVYTTFTHNGTDNWNACTNMLPMFGYSGDYFDYYDIQEKKIKYTFKEDWFKDILKTYNKLVRDGVASSEALIDQQQNFNEKYNNGRYLVALLTVPPIGNENFQYTYRKVYAKYTNGWDKILNVSGGPSTLKKMSFFKKGISESELIQALRAVDFQCSLPGQKLTFWGAKSAGLYTEDENGKLKYTNEELEKQMIDTNTYGVDLIDKYGLREGHRPGRPVCYTSPFNVFAHYDRPSTVESKFNAFYVDPITYPTYINADFYTRTADLPGAKSFWQKREAFETALTQIFASADDAQFEERYNSLLALAERNGLTDQVLEDYQKILDEENKVNEGNIEAYLEENAYRTK